MTYLLTAALSASALSSLEVVFSSSEATLDSTSTEVVSIALSSKIASWGTTSAASVDCTTSLKLFVSLNEILQTHVLIVHFLTWEVIQDL
jgi:hypothetical protein